VGGGAPLRVFETSDLSGNSVHIAGDRLSLAFSRDGGFLRQCVAGGMPLLLEFPALHVLPRGNPLRPLPDPISWRFQGLDVNEEGGNVRVKIRGSYAGFAGRYDWTIAPSGEIEVDSEFTYSGEDILAREVGLRFSVPRECHLLEWQRDADWESPYPIDHIGRPSGEAWAFESLPNNVLPEQVPPSGRSGLLLRDPNSPQWSYSQDPSSMGTNDFRSTKRNIRWSAIGYAWEGRRPVPRPFGFGQASFLTTGPSVRILSDGSKHLRAMAEPDRISVHVNDFFGGTNAGWWEWELNYGKGRLIKKGEVLKSTLRLRLSAK
jgi:hypothetical protein